MVQAGTLGFLLLFLPGSIYAQELNSQNKDLDLSTQPAQAVESVEVGTGSGSTHPGYDAFCFVAPKAGGTTVELDRAPRAESL